MFSSGTAGSIPTSTTDDGPALYDGALYDGALYDGALYDGALYDGALSCGLRSQLRRRGDPAGVGVGSERARELLGRTRFPTPEPVAFALDLAEFISNPAMYQ